MTDIVYKLGIGSKHNDKELRYSLRSLSYFKDLGKVYIIGHRPAWITNVIHYPLEDVFKANKDANLINKLILASHDNNISQEFINFSDDQILLRECDYNDFLIPYYDDSLINFKPDEKLGRWKTRLKNTVRILQEKGLSYHCYESHIPTLLDKDKFIQVVFQYNYAEGQGMCGNTLYYNTLKKKSAPLPVNYAIKLESALLNYNDLENICKGRLHLNFAEAAENDNLFVFLENTFPLKSKYERY